MNTPKLRFKNFIDNWAQHKIGDFFEHLATGSTPSRLNSNYFKGDIPWISSGELKSHYISKTKEYITEKAVEETNLKIYPPGTMFIAITGLEAKGTRSSAAINTIPMTTNQSCLAFPANDSINLDFLYFWYKKNGEKIGITYTQGTKQQSLTPSLVKNLEISIPSIKEQSKIAQFFNLIEKKIEHQQEKIDLLKEQKKGYMQRIFSQELRFKDDDGNEFPKWGKYKLSDFTERVTRKNKGIVTTRPLTISAQHGLIDQVEFFNKTVASENLEGYYLLNKGEFAYNKSYSNGYPLGAIKRLNRYDNGALSTLYICFKTLSNVDSDFLIHYFDSTAWYKEVSVICVEGARNHGLLNVSVNEFFETVHILPSKKEQQVIADFLNKLNRKIDLNELLLDNLLKQKQAFMQQMFI